MADLKISQFADGGAVQTTDEIATNRAGTNTKVVVGSAAALDAGTDIGDLVQVIDVGGSPGLPAVDGSLLTGISGGGGSSAFNAITSGTNTTATMTVGTGASIAATGTGTIAATTSAALQTARTIGGVSFDGTANIVPQTIQMVNDAADTTCFIMFGNASGTQSQQPKTNTGLTYNAATNSVGATTFVGALTGNVTGNVTGSSGSTTGNAATATALQTARTINGTSFDGTANIILNPRVSTTASSSTPTPNAGTDDLYTITALAANATFGAPSGTPVNGQALVIRIKDNGTARTLAYNAIYRALGVTLPTTTVISKTLYLGMIYNSADTKWDVTGVAQEA